MKVLVIFIAGFLATCFAVTGQNSEKNQYNDLLIVEYSVSGVVNSSQATMICRELIKDENVIFCDINSDFTKMTVVSKKSKDITLNIRGSVFVTGASKQFSKLDFFNLYNNSCLKRTDAEKESDLPAFIDSGNPEKDDLNYFMVKSIYIELFPEKYKKMTK